MDDRLDNEFIGIEEAAELTGYSVHTLRKYAQQKRVPFYQRSKGSPLWFRESELREWAAPKRVGPEAAA